MFYAQESYEKIEKILRTLCVVPLPRNHRAYEILKYKTDVDAFFIASEARERYLLNYRYFETCPPRIPTGAEVEKKVAVNFVPFASDMTASGSVSLSGNGNVTAKRYIDFMVGVLEVDGKKTGTIFAFSDTGTLHAVKAVLGKFVILQAAEKAEEDFEKSLLQLLRASRVF
jgi:hypothetical protein